ncbi:MAG: MBL fold metallo-hydrolase [Lachnospiraceae bacterium]|jgi:L-ascorbate metabolism protein UlaG (beta-lactamase superfamily)|nr:MBL fold metallo-hydrolase [Lachnospiraceae bacterium]
MKVTYIHHSTFCVETEGKALVFDYYDGKGVPDCTYHGKMPELPRETPLYVFSSHSHRDHFSPEVLQWYKEYPNIHYIFAKEVKKKLGSSVLRKQGVGEGIKEKITYVKHNEQIRIDGARIETLLSTDSGVAFLVTVSGKTVYHAGDLNWWKWEGEPEEFNAYQERTYKEQIGLLAGRDIDLAFVVMDPRQEQYQFLGIQYFMEHVKARHVVPMHLWKQYRLALEYRKGLPAGEQGRILAVTHENQELEL